MFIDVKSIQAVVAMIPHIPVIDRQVAHERFFLVEKPGLDVAVMSGAEEVYIRDGMDENPDQAAA